jgi:uncharacterized protein (TIGR00251 family)
MSGTPCGSGRQNSTSLPSLSPARRHRTTRRRARDDPSVSDDARIAVRLQPRAARDEIVGLRDGILVVRVTAPPVDGRANRALCKLVAQRAGVAASRVSVVRGKRSRDKLVAVEGVKPEALAAALAGS